MVTSCLWYLEHLLLWRAWMLYEYLTNVNSTWQMPLGSICLPHVYCSTLARVTSIACQDSCPDQAILSDLPASSLCSFKSIIHLYLIFTRIPMLLGSIIHFHLNFTLMAKLPFLLYSSIMSFTSSETFEISTAYRKVCISYFDIHSPLSLCL